jgi:hypothetical protein
MAHPQVVQETQAHLIQPLAIGAQIDARWLQVFRIMLTQLQIKRFYHALALRAS